MKLGDLRRYAVKQNLCIRFKIRQGLECIIDQHGVARIPELRAAPGVNLESELQDARQFTLEPAGGARLANPKQLTRQELEAVTTAPGGSAAPPDGTE